jgi:hypothetical protein
MSAADYGKAVYAEEEWQRERMISPKGYQRAIAQLGMNTAQAGRWLGVSKRTGYRYATGETAIPTAVVLLLGAARRHVIRPLVPPPSR